MRSVCSFKGQHYLVNSKLCGKGMRLHLNVTQVCVLCCCLMTGKARDSTLSQRDAQARHDRAIEIKKALKLEQAKLEAEAETYGDILFIDDLVDTYRYETCPG